MDASITHPQIVMMTADGSQHGSRQASREGSTHNPRRQDSYDRSLESEFRLESLSLGSPPAKLSPAAPGAPAELEAAEVVVEEPQQPLSCSDCTGYFKRLPSKLQGGIDTRLPIPPLHEFVFAFVGSFLGILAVAALNQWASPEIDLPFIVGSLGASAVLVFAVVESKLSQPRNFIGGQVLSSVVGVIVRIAIPHTSWIAQPVAVSLAVVVMMLTSTTHPPGGATALIVAGASTLPRWHGFSYCVTVAVSSCSMLVVALVVNNLNPRRVYPTFWL